ncbi:MAG: anti-sigma factor [Methylococcaceae bacterium]|jgi:anti-sigma factor RsiW
MECSDITKLLHAYIDSELDYTALITVENHLEGCPACQYELQMLSTLQISLRSNADYYPMPLATLQRLQLSIQPQVAKTRSQVSLFKQFIPGLVTAFASVILAFGISHVVLFNHQQEQLAEDVVASHIRSLQAEHITDVASSDQHTVKPWFTGKLNYSPHVVDLTEQGFPLVGGRLDYLKEQPVTALVYRRRQHLINVFIWPYATKAAISETEQTINGYHLYSFIQTGMVYWVISDLNAKELKTLVDILRRPA